MHRARTLALTVGLIVALAASAFPKSQSGSIHGTVLDNARKPLSGASVLIYGPSVLGSNVFITGQTGRFHFPQLLPGRYVLQFEMPGHNTQRRTGLVVGLGKTLQVTAVLDPAEMEEEVVVDAPSPMIDAGSAKLSINYEAAVLAGLPRNRDLYAVQNTFPGAVSEDSYSTRTSSLLGGTVRGPLYTLDGAPVNDSFDFNLLANVNTEALEEVEYQAAGHPAEVGPTDGGYVNIITRTGGSKLMLGLSAYLAGKGLNSNLLADEELADLGVRPPEQYQDEKDFSLAIGGPLWGDALWFYALGRHMTWDKLNPYTPETRLAALGLEGSHYDFSHREWMGFAKATLQVTKNIRYSGMFHFNNVYEPSAVLFAGPDVSSDAAPVLDNENIYTTTHHLNYVMNPATFVDLRASYIQRILPFIGKDDTKYASYDVTRNVAWGTAPYSDEQDRRRMTGTLVLTRYEDGFLGANHEFKLGAEIEQSDFHRDWFKANPYYSYWYDYGSKNPYYYSPALKQGRLRILTAPGAPENWDVQDNIRRFTGFVQDNLRAGRLALNLGLRFDYSYQYEPEMRRPALSYLYKPELLADGLENNSLLVALSNQMKAAGLVSPWESLSAPYKRVVSFATFSPRIGLAYDITGQGKTVAKASWSRYFTPLWSSFYYGTRIFQPGAVDFRWNDLNGNGRMDLPDIDSYSLVSTPGQDPTVSPYAEDLKAPHTDEVTAGLEHELRPDVKLGFHFVYKIDKDIIDDYDVNNGFDPGARDDRGPIWIPFTFTDPGWDGAFGTADDQKLTAYGLRADRPAPLWKLGNIPDAKRRYWALILTFDKRMTNRWQLKGSLVYSSYKGNISAGFAETDGSAAAFNDPNSMVNAYGRLWFDRPLQLKVMASYLLPWDIAVSAYFQISSGTPWNRTIGRVYFPADLGAAYGGVQSPYVVLSAEAPGSNRDKAYVNLDIHAEKSFVTKERGRLALVLDVFNLTGHHGQILGHDPAGILHYDTRPVTYQVSADYGRVLAVYGVRSARIGVRLSF